MGKKEKKELCEKGNYTEEEFDYFLDILLENIDIVNAESVKEHLNEAEEIMKDIDIKDASFIAAALAINADGIWSFDEHFNKQKKFRVFSIRELIRMF